MGKKKGGGWESQKGAKSAGGGSNTVDRNQIPMWMRDAMSVQEEQEKSRKSVTSKGGGDDGEWETKGGYGGKTW